MKGVMVLYVALMAFFAACILVGIKTKDEGFVFVNLLFIVGLYFMASRHGGKRDGAGRKPGPIADTVKMGISISRENAEWLKAEKRRGKSISRIIDMALDAMRDNR